MPIHMSSIKIGKRHIMSDVKIGEVNLKLSRNTLPVKKVNFSKKNVSEKTKNKKTYNVCRF